MTNLAAKAVDAAEIADGYKDTVDAIKANQPQYTELAPIPAAEYNSTIRKVRASALAQGFGVRVVKRVTAGEGDAQTITATVGLDTPQTRNRKPKDGTDTPEESSDTAAAKSPKASKVTDPAEVAAQA